MAVPHGHVLSQALEAKAARKSSPQVGFSKARSLPTCGLAGVSKIELVVNVKTERTHSFAFSSVLLTRVDEVIE